MGIAAIALFIMLAGALLWLLVFVVQPLTSTTAVTDRIVDALLPELENQQSADQETVRLLMGLENAATGIRIATLQVAVATLGGFFLIVVGVLLFAVGASGAFKANVEGGEFALSLSDLTPGIAAALLGGLLIGLGVYRDVKPPTIIYKNTSSAQDTSSKYGVWVDEIEFPDDSPYGKRTEPANEDNPGGPAKFSL